MAQSRYYSSVAQDTTLSASVTASITTLSVGATTGFPVSFPYTLVIDPDTATQEIVTVTSAAGTSLTVTRGEDGTAAVGHDAGAVVQHSHTARDFRESREHEDATTGVHGITDTSTLVVTTDPRMTNARTPVAHTHTTDDITGTGWVAYTPSWTAATTNPVIGDGTLTGFYRKIGRTTHFRIAVTMGSTTTYGTGAWSLTLPVPAVTGGSAYWPARAVDVSASQAYSLFLDPNTASSAVVRAPGTTAGGPLTSATGTYPFTWASGDTFAVTGTYEAAS